MDVNMQTEQFSVEFLFRKKIYEKHFVAKIYGTSVVILLTT